LYFAITIFNVPNTVFLLKYNYLIELFYNNDVWVFLSSKFPTLFEILIRFYFGLTQKRITVVLEISTKCLYLHLCTWYSIPNILIWAINRHFQFSIFSSLFFYIYVQNFAGTKKFENHIQGPTQMAFLDWNIDG